MHTLRTSLSLARLVMAWFMLTFGVAVAAPAMAPHTLVMLCSHAGEKAVIVDADGKLVTSASATMDCPQCLPVTAPPPAFSLSIPAPASTCAITQPSVQVHVPRAAGAPLPARGPPLV